MTKSTRKSNSTNLSLGSDVEHTRAYKSPCLSRFAWGCLLITFTLIVTTAALIYFEILQNPALIAIFISSSIFILFGGIFFIQQKTINRMTLSSYLYYICLCLIYFGMYATMGYFYLKDANTFFQNRENCTSENT